MQANNPAFPQNSYSAVSAIKSDPSLVGARFVLGVDGGGTKTLAAIMDERGQMVGSGQSGPSNYDDVGVDRARENIALAVEQARAQAMLQGALLPDRFSAVFLGMAGVVSETDRAVIRAIAGDLRLAAPDRTGVDHDIRIALAGGLSGRPGIVLITGTGSSCYGRNAQGQHWQAGGWGHLIADEGSGYWLGIQAIRLAMMIFDGRASPAPRGKPSRLVEVVKDYLGLADMQDMMHRLYITGLSRAEIAGLAPRVLEAARSGDPYAGRLIRQGAREVAQYVQAAARHLAFHEGPCEVALSGGLTQAGPVFLQPLEEAIHGRLPHSKILLAEQSPVKGACLLALQIAE